MKTLCYCRQYHDKGQPCPNRRKPNPQTEARKTRQKYRVHKAAKLAKEQAHWLCQNCLAQGKHTYTNLHAHHIKPIHTHPHLADDLTNLKVLCEECHQAEHDKQNIQSKIIINNPQ